VSGFTYTGPLSQQELDEALGSGPLIFAVRWSGGGGHAMTIGGCGNGQYYVHNSLTYAGEWETLSYNDVMYYQGGEGRWEQTFMSGSYALVNV